MPAPAGGSASGELSASDRIAIMGSGLEKLKQMVAEHAKNPTDDLVEEAARVADEIALMLGLVKKTGLAEAYFNTHTKVAIEGMSPRIYQGKIADFPKHVQQARQDSLSPTNAPYDGHMLPLLRSDRMRLYAYLVHSVRSWETTESFQEALRAAGMSSMQSQLHRVSLVQTEVLTMAICQLLAGGDVVKQLQGYVDRAVQGTWDAMLALEEFSALAASVSLCKYTRPDMQEEGKSAVNLQKHARKVRAEAQLELKSKTPICQIVLCNKRGETVKGPKYVIWILEYLTQLAFIELAERLLKQKRVLILNFSAAATVANISRLPGLNNQHWQSGKPFGLLHDKYVCSTVVTFYQVHIDRSYTSTPTFGPKIVEPRTITSSAHTPSFITAARDIMEKASVTGADKQGDDDVRSALQRVFVQHKLQEVQQCPQQQLIDCQSLLERLADCVAADDTVQTLKTQVRVILSKFRSPNPTVILLRTAVAGTNGFRAAPDPWGARLFPRDIGNGWTKEERNEYLHSLSVFAHVVGTLPDDWRDKIPKRAFQEFGLKTKFWPLPEFRFVRNQLRTIYGHGPWPKGFMHQVYASTGGGPEKAKEAYWNHILAVASDAAHPSHQTVMGVLDVIYRHVPT